MIFTPKIIYNIILDFSYNFVHVTENFTFVYLRKEVTYAIELLGFVSYTNHFMKLQSIKSCLRNSTS